MIRIIIFIIISLIPFNAFALSNYQKQVAKIAFKYGKEIGFPELVQGIAYQETKFGKYKNYKNLHHNYPIDKQYFGIMQIKLCAYYDVKKFKKLKYSFTKTEIVDKLKNDDEFNIMIGTYYLEYLLKYFNNDIKKAILAYNFGLGNVKKYGLKKDKWNYVESVLNHIKGIISDTNFEMQLFYLDRKSY